MKIFQYLFWRHETWGTAITGKVCKEGFIVSLHNLCFKMYCLSTVL